MDEFDERLGLLRGALVKARDALGADVSVLRLVILLSVYRDNGMTQSDLLASLPHVSATAMSRNIAELSDRKIRGRRGLGLLKLIPDDENLRRKHVRLTPRGRRLVESLLRLEPPVERR